MNALILGLFLVLLIAAVSVAIGALGRVVLGLLFPAPAPGPDDDPRWVRPGEGARIGRARTPGEAFERGSTSIARTLRPDATVPVARLAQSPESRRVEGAEGPDRPATTGPVGTAVDRIAVRF
ncbi:hypothetical protein [Brachybacterium endophyticum]|uniref:hypothetical protein n=1 Tax=Brachybacterium endophyticum TaxID=2182385 RepID=UPI0010578C5F|nr:hypothetical protein [Brachybacterium endophyticum]